MTSPACPITTHVLDTSLGKPAEGIKVLLERLDGANWTELARYVTNSDGRIADWWQGPLTAATYRLTFSTGDYISNGFYPEVPIIFSVKNDTQHYHVPLLLNPFGYSTYRGS